MNPVHLQKQLKNNANDLQEFYKDLKNWGEDMKRKEESLKNNESCKKPKVSKKKMSAKVENLPRKIGSIDYSKWDKYDAEAECERLEDDIKDDSELSDEFEVNIRDEALVHKEKGNSYVKTKEWDKAIDCYTKAIKCYSYDAVFYANRALCHLKKGNYTAAEGDCTLSLKLDRTYVKALQRRAAARENLNNLELAEHDLEMVLQYEPNNKESKAALANVRKKIGPKEKLADVQRPVSKFTASRSKFQHIAPSIIPSTSSRSETQKNVPQKSNIDASVSNVSNWSDVGDVISVKSIQKPPHLRSKKPLKRIEIKEIDSVLEAENATPPKKLHTEPDAVKKYVVEKVENEDFRENGKGLEQIENKKCVEKMHVKEAVAISNEHSKNEKFRGIKIVERSSELKEKEEQIKNRMIEKKLETAWPKANEKVAVIKSDELRVMEKKSTIENNPKNAENVIVTKKGSENNEITDFQIPKTSVQFYHMWKNFKNPAEKFKFLKMIEPNELPKIFQESLESNIFSSILDVLSTQFIENKENVYKILVCLTKVKRFSALTMFMDNADNVRLWKLIDYLREQEIVPKEDVDSLIQKYEL